MESAFPQIYTHMYDEDGSNLPHGNVHSEGGLSLRDWFAGQALAATFGKELVRYNGDGFVNDEDIATVAANAYSIADAMIKAREDGQ